MKRAILIVLAAFSLLYGVQSTYSQQKRARDNYQNLKLLPNYRNAPAAEVTRFDFKVL
jgi:hypothetical protein